MLISGGTGSGKTTTLNALTEFIGDGERIVTVEDAAELRLRHAHVVRLEARPASLEGRGEVTVRRLVRNALRMRPDRIVVGEVRGGEALDMLSAMSSGHDGSLSTVHAGSPEEALRRVETLALMAGLGLPHEAIREQLAGALDLVVHQARMPDGSRRVVAVSEVVRVAAGAGHPRALHAARRPAHLARAARRPSRRAARGGAGAESGMSPAVLLAGLAGACALLAAWEAIAAAEQERAVQSLSRWLAPLLEVLRSGREPTSPERRRLALLGVAGAAGRRMARRRSLGGDRARRRRALGGTCRRPHAPAPPCCRGIRGRTRDRPRAVRRARRRALGARCAHRGGARRRDHRAGG